MKNKNQLRKEALKLRNNKDSSDLEKLNKGVLNQILNSCDYIKSHSIFVFVSYGSEVDTKKLITYSLKEKKVYIPFTKEDSDTMTMVEIYSLDELVPGHMGILNLPESLAQKRIRHNVDLVLSPGLLFDDQGYRLGYGGGFYDKFFEKNVHKTSLGIGYNFQRIDKIPHAANDIPLDGFISEKGVEYFNHRQSAD